jgi:cell division protein ZapA
VNIYGREYSIRGEGDPSYVSEIAHYVDMKMRQMTDNITMASSAKVAILAALNITDELFQKERQLKELEEGHGKALARLADRIEEALDGSAPPESAAEATQTERASREERPVHSGTSAGSASRHSSE